MWQIAVVNEKTRNIETKQELKKFLKTKLNKDYNFYSLGRHIQKLTKKGILESPHQSFIIVPEVR